MDWWNPTGREEPSGADIGGHPDAERVWARKDPGRWKRRTYGINAIIAWSCEYYRNEYLRWVDAERPKREPFVSIALPLDEQKKRWDALGLMPKEDRQPLPRATETEDDEDEEEIPF